MRTHFRNDKNPVIQRALKVLEDSKSGHLVATREVVYYGNFRKDVERSEARKRKIRKELAKLEQGRQETYNDFLRNFHVFKSYD